MDLSALLPVGTLVLGIVLTFFAGLLNGHISNKREEKKAVKADESRRGAIGREHATRALAIIRAARDDIWTRQPVGGHRSLDLDGLSLEVADAEIDLIPDPLLRPRLASVLSAVRYPWTLANGSYSQGYPIETQRQGLYLLQEALAKYVREEPTPDEPDALTKLAKANADAQEERAEWERENRDLDK
ncbi:MAG: hypothetical protein ACOH19_10425 [Rhodoglobus sp.]